MPRRRGRRHSVTLLCNLVLVWPTKSSSRLGFERRSQSGVTGVQLPTVEQSTKYTVALNSGSFRTKSRLWFRCPTFGCRRDPTQVQVMDWYACFSLVAQEESWNQFRFDPRRGMANPGLRFFFAPLSLVSEGCGAAGGQAGRRWPLAFENARWASVGHFFFAVARVGEWVAGTAGNPSLLATSAVRSTSPVEKQPMDG